MTTEWWCRSHSAIDGECGVFGWHEVEPIQIETMSTMSALSEALDTFDSGEEPPADQVGELADAARSWQALVEKVEAGAEVWVEWPCPCGKPPSWFKHKVPEHDPMCETDEYGCNDDWHAFCGGGKREKVMG